MSIGLIEIIGLIGILIISCSGIPQLLKTLKTKSVKDLSLPFFIMLLVGVILLSIYTVEIGNIIYTVGNSITFVITLVIIISIFKWKNN